jgi:hypothetical protein
MSGHYAVALGPSSYFTVNKQASLFEKGNALEDRLWNFLDVAPFTNRLHRSFRRTARSTPQRSTQRNRAFSFPRKELNEVRHGFQQHIFIDLLRAAALP